MLVELGAKRMPGCSWLQYFAAMRIVYEKSDLHSLLLFHRELARTHPERPAGTSSSLIGILSSCLWISSLILRSCIYFGLYSTPGARYVVERCTE